MKRILILILCSFLTFSLFSQQSKTKSETNQNSNEKEKTQKNKTNDNLPNGYRNITLGMSLEDTKQTLLNEPEFGYTGDRDVSLTPGDAQYIIETDATKGLGSLYLTQCWFQFYNEKLYIITININKEKMDYYTMFTTFQNKYGEPVEIDPSKAVWKNDSVTIILEKPLRVKYIDTQIYENIINLSEIDISAEEMSRELFLEDF